MASCPFHEGDRHPSFTVYPTGTYFCFSCEVWGDAVKFLVEYKGMTQAQALEYCGVDYKVRRSAKIIKIRSTHAAYQFLSDVADVYHNFLLEMPGAVRYLKSRGIAEETMKKYKLGYTDGSVLSLRLGAEVKLAEDCGLLTKSGYEILSHRIVIPNLVGKDLCDFMIGRTVLQDKIKYLGIKVPKPIFGLFELRTSPILFLVEGQFDWLTLRQWGYPAVVVGGTHITPLNRAVLKHRKIIVIPDNDAVGLLAATRVQKALPDVEIVDYSYLGVKDISELAEVEGGRKIFEQVIRSQEWITTISPRTLARWFPPSLSTIPSLST